ncbi:hypothetical protein KP509_08G035600 [Ceratopteris richardii]|uniref:Uncharacterized protein n=1 Tax=Ceratopteris richardii TaxID=49495 RepID=A0A8T2U4S6_CERRI|nr:hypothetical protein KP509_08G035600 [Ceratopteris richardii]
MTRVYPNLCQVVMLLAFLGAIYALFSAAEELQPPAANGYGEKAEFLKAMVGWSLTHGVRRLRRDHMQKATVDDYKAKSEFGSAMAHRFRAATRKLKKSEDLRDQLIYGLRDENEIAVPMTEKLGARGGIPRTEGHGHWLLDTASYAISERREPSQAEKDIAELRSTNVVDRRLRGAEERKLVWHATFRHNVPSSPNRMQNDIPDSINLP